MDCLPKRLQITEQARLASFEASRISPIGTHAEYDKIVG